MERKRRKSFDQMRGGAQGTEKVRLILSRWNRQDEMRYSTRRYLTAMAMMNQLCCVLPRCGCSSTVWITRHRYPEVVDIPWGMRSTNRYRIVLPCLPCFYESKWLPPLGLITKLLSNGLLLLPRMCEDGQARDAQQSLTCSTDYGIEAKEEKGKRLAWDPPTMAATTD